MKIDLQSGAILCCPFSPVLSTMHSLSLLLNDFANRSFIAPFSSSVTFICLVFRSEDFFFFLKFKERSLKKKKQAFSPL